MPRALLLFVIGAICCALALPSGQSQSQASGLPEGAGKELVEGVCTGRHQTSKIRRSSGYTGMVAEQRRSIYPDVG